MQALVTGATGFLGSHLIELAQAFGYQVRALARNKDRARPLEATGVRVVLGDLTDPESLAAAVRGCAVVFHAAALVTNWAPWREFARTTVRGTENLLRTATRAGVERFVHVSTIRVYDDRCCRRLPVVTEDTPFGARGHRHFGSYARAKVLAEQLVWRWHAQGDVPVTVLRPAWIYGPRDETILPPLVQFLRSPSAHWPSWTDPCVDPIFVTDVAACALAAARSPAAAGQAYNVAPVRVIRLREFLSELCQALGITLPRHSLPYPLTASITRLTEVWARLTFRRTAPAYTRAGLAILTQDIHHASGKAQRELHWRPETDIATGVGRTAAWFRERFPGGSALTPGPVGT